MRTKKILFYLLAGILAGCVPVMSLHPLYNKEAVVFEEKLLGTWVDDANETTWEFQRVVDEPNDTIELEHPEEPNKAYRLIYSSKESGKGSFFAHLVKLNDKLFLDVYPSHLPFVGAYKELAKAWEKTDHQKGQNKVIKGIQLDPNEIEMYPLNIWFLIPVHTFIKVDSIEPKLRMWLTDDDDMEKLLKEDPNAIEHEFVEDKLILTASTKKLQAFVLKYANDSRVFSNEIILTRKETKGPDESKMTDPNATGQNKE